jgi:hypothetical protein
MSAWVLAALAVQAGNSDEAALRRFAALLARPETRARGVDRLSHVDPAALGRLPGLDPDILRAAEAHAALRHSYGPPRLFSLDGREEEVEEILARLERDSGLSFHRSSLPRGAKVALRLEEASVLEALVEIGRAASFSVAGSDGALLYLQPSVPPARPRVFHGPVMVELERICRRARVGFDGVTRDFWMRFAVWWEPHVLPLDGKLACVVKRAVDDSGRSLLQDPPRPPVARTDNWPLSSPGIAILEGLRTPEADARSLTVEGAVELRLAAEVEIAVFEKPGVVKRPGVSIELKSLVPAETGGTVATIRLTFEDPARAQEHRPGPRDLVIDSDVPPRGLRTTVSGLTVKESEVEYTVRVPGIRPEDARRYQVRVPRGSVVKRVPFLFEGVGLR